MKSFVIGLVIVLGCSALYGQNNTQTFRSSTGKLEGRAVTSRDGRSTSYYSSTGKYLGKSTQGATGTTIRGSRGELKGSASGKTKVSPSYFRGAKK